MHAVPLDVRSVCSVHDRLRLSGWIRQIKGPFSLAMIVQFCSLWSRVQIHGSLRLNGPDSFRWIWTALGIYSVSLVGLTSMPNTEEVWGPRAPSQLKFFTWLVVNNRFWTSNRLLKRGLPHQPCYPLCLQEPETISYLLIQRSYARSVWLDVLRVRGWDALTPSPINELVEWWT